MDYKYVDETADIARHYSVDWECDASSPLGSERRRSERSEASLDQRPLTEPSIISDTVGSHSSKQFLPHRSVGGALAGYSPYPLESSPGNRSSLSSTSPGYSHSSQVSPGSRDLISQIQSVLPSLDEHEACLMRYFVVQLAPWVCCLLLESFLMTDQRFSLIYVMETDFLLVLCPYELEHALPCSTPSTLHQQDT